MIGKFIPLHLPAWGAGERNELTPMMNYLLEVLVVGTLTSTVLADRPNFFSEASTRDHFVAQHMQANYQRC
jgi:hypothetical protein